MQPVLATKFRSQLAKVEQIFIGQPAASQCDRLFAGFFKARSSRLQSFIPTDGNQLAPLAHHRLGKPLFAFGKMIGKPALVANPDLVHGFVLARHDPFDDIAPAGARRAAHINGEVTAHRAVGTKRGGCVHLPGAGPKPEITGSQGAHGADVGCIAGENGIEPRIRERHNFQRTAAL